MRLVWLCGLVRFTKMQVWRCHAVDGSGHWTVSAGDEMSPRQEPRYLAVALPAMILSLTHRLPISHSICFLPCLVFSFLHSLARVYACALARKPSLGVVNEEKHIRLISGGKQARPTPTRFRFYGATA